MNGFWRFANVISPNGISYDGWPWDFEDNRFYGSPVVHDRNGDGLEEIVSIDDNGVLRVLQVVVVGVIPCS